MQPRIVILMRHAKSDWKSGVTSDHDRPLNSRGRRAAGQMGRHLEKLQITVDAVLASTACRVRQTLELMRQEWQRLDPEIVYCQGLYLATPGQILRQISQADECWQHLLVIGHNPGMEDLASSLAGRPIEFPTACAALFEVTVNRWQDILSLPGDQVRSKWIFKHAYRPKELDE
ncbi:MAG: histidine phosphatase family protein [Pirellulaceae bacterium]|nr:histidine phosphatase family protein [Pirellulaceae bacterium]